ncbi:MAG: glutamyl-tRNA reductase [Planctomycetota bacterium]|jgi:glutamyl-tRNA reductase
MIEFVCLSRNHTNTPLELREALRFPEEEITGILQELGHSCQITDAVLLCTCNRTELYFSGSVQEHLEPALTALGHLRGIEPWKKEETLILEGVEAFHHLLRVAAGLESLVLGENQILGQLKAAFALACEAQANGFLINEIFHRAFRLGKQVRSQTRLCAGNTSVGRMAVEQAEALHGIHGKDVLVIGAGEIGELVLSALLEYQAGTITVANRRRRRIVDTIEQAGGTWIPLEQLDQGLAVADLVFSCTASADYIVRPEHIPEDRSERPLHLFDLALPRDIDPRLGERTDIHLTNIDDLQPHIEAVHELRRNEIPKVEALVTRATEQFETWVHELSAIPSIRRLSRLMEETRTSSIRPLGKKLEEADFQRVETESRRLTRRLLNVIIGELKRTARNAGDRKTG